MSLEDVSINPEAAINEAAERTRFLKEYQEECKRIYNGVDVVNKALNGRMAVEIPIPYGEGGIYLLLRGVHSQRELDKPDFWGEKQYYTIFILGSNILYTAKTTDPNYPNDVAAKAEEKRYRILFDQIVSTEVNGGELQNAIDLSLEMAVPQGPPINAKELKDICVQIGRK